MPTQNVSSLMEFFVFNYIDCTIYLHCQLFLWAELFHPCVHLLSLHSLFTFLLVVLTR